MGRCFLKPRIIIIEVFIVLICGIVISHFVPLTFERPLDDVNVVVNTQEGLMYPPYDINVKQMRQGHYQKMKYRAAVNSGYRPKSSEDLGVTAPSSLMYFIQHTVLGRRTMLIWDNTDEEVGFTN